MIYNNQNLKNTFKAYLKKEIARTTQDLSLNIIQVGEDLASSKYISIKQKVGLEMGIQVRLHKFTQNYTESAIREILASSQKDKAGLIFQLPVPADLKTLVRATSLITDVDLLGDYSQQLWSKEFLPPTIGAIDLVLKDILVKDGLTKDISGKLNLAGKNVVVIGQGVLVGNPLMQYLKDRDATIISINKYTQFAAELCKMGEIVISAAGSPYLITSDWLRQGSIVVDASTSEENGKLVGDIDRTNLPEDICLCPSPGGIGPITVLYLFYNLLKLSQLNL